MECHADKLIDVSSDHSLDVARARLITDNMKWVASKLLSSRYGDRMQTEIVGKDGESFGAGTAAQLANVVAAAMRKREQEGDDDGLA